MAVFVYSILLSIIQSYATFYNLFPNFSVGYAPELFVVVSFSLLGAILRVRDVLIVSVLAPVFSFGILQLVGYSFFRKYGTYNILLTVLAKGAVGFGLAWLLVGVVFGTISNLLFSKGNGQGGY